MWHFVTWLLHLFYVMWFYICISFDNDDIYILLNNFGCYCCCVDFRISTYRELSPGGLWTLMSTGRDGQIWPLLFVKPRSPTPQSIQNNRPHSSNFVILLIGNWWKLLCFEAKKRLVNCILQKNKWWIWIEQPLSLLQLCDIVSDPDLICKSSHAHWLAGTDLHKWQILSEAKMWRLTLTSPSVNPPTTASDSGSLNKPMS